MNQYTNVIATINNIFEEIESTSFYLKTGIASFLSHFKAIILSSEAAQRLSRENISGEILDRILDISQREIDNDFENPYDAALATYLLILKEKDGVFANRAALIVFNIKNCFWAEKIAGEILTGPSAPSKMKS